MAKTRPYIATHKRALFVVQGVVAMLMGIALLTTPVQAMLTVVTVLGGYFFIRGVANMLYIAIDSTGWGWKLLVGSMGMVAGVLALIAPQVTGTAFALFVFIIAGQGILSGLIEIYYGGVYSRVGLAILGIVSVVLAAMLFFVPWVGISSAAIIMGAVGLVGGFATFVSALRGARTLQPRAA